MCVICSRRKPCKAETSLTERQSPMSPAKITICMLAALLAISCTKLAPKEEQPPTKDPTTTVAENEYEFQRRFKGDEMRAEVRKTAADFIKANLPKWNIKGISAQSYENGVFWVDVDIESEGRQRTIGCYVQRFFPEAGEPYWKAMLLRGDLKQRLHSADDAARLRELNNLQDEVDSLKNPPEPEPDDNY